MSVAVTRGVRVEVESTFLPERSAPTEGTWLFAYRVRIANQGRATVQLLRREWLITDGDGNVQRVEGEGVVGEQPVLAPGEGFEYTSFCPLPTPFGTMHGSYLMVTADGVAFGAEIAPFALAVEAAVH
jgi:ApaG protein